MATAGVLADKDVTERYIDGLNEAVRRIQPKKLVVVSQKENVMDLTPLSPENARKTEIFLIKNANLVRLEALKRNLKLPNEQVIC